MKFLDTFEILARKLDVKLRLILAFTVILAGVTGLMGIYATSVMSAKVVYTAQQKLASDLKMGSHIIDMSYPGEWNIVNGQLFKGPKLIEGDFKLVDEIGEMTGDTVTIFNYDTRVSTNVKKDGQRQVGTKVSEQVAEQVLQQGVPYTGRAVVAGSQNETDYEPIKDATGKIIGILYVGVPAAPYDNLVNKFRISMTAYSAAGIFFGFLAAFLIAYSVYAPLTRIKEGVERAAEGDLRNQVDHHVNDQPGLLAKAVNIMVDRISELIRKSRDLSMNVGVSANQLLKSSEMSASLMEDMTGKANEMSRNASRQAELAGYSKKTIANMSTAIGQLNQNTAEVFASATTAASRAREGEKHIEQAINQISIISDTVNCTAQLVEGLGRKSQEIDQISDLITNVANQTNLLALNAAIEAARAGDQGKGFAVVAEEVRKLAEESGEAAQRIAGLIKEIQNEADRAVQAMQEGIHEVAAGTDIVTSAGVAFQQIIQSISLVNKQLQQIGTANKEMSLSAENAIQAIEEVTDSAEQNALGVTLVSQLAEEQMAGIEEVNASIDKLNGIVSELEHAIAFFTV